MSIQQKAKLLYFVGCAITFAAGLQMAAAIFGGRPEYAVVGIACGAFAIKCCRDNWRMWHS
jgi:hypothetical protein